METSLVPVDKSAKMVVGTKKVAALKAMMNSQIDQPTVLLCSADPKAPFSEDLAAAWARGSFTQAAVAFLTAGGVEFFAQHCLEHQDREQCRLCFTVQWPTDLDAVARLLPQLGPNLRIHLGAKTPVEFSTDVTPMLHSKAVYTDNGDGTCTAFIGSHNWTANALNGVNFEASVRIACNTTDAFAVDLREHLVECFRRCVPFDLNDLAYYKAVQRVLSSRRPPAPDAEEVTAFERLQGAPAVVIHAEGNHEQVGMGKAYLFLPVLKRSMAKWFNTTTPTTVLLFLYEPGTLFGRQRPASRPVLFQGPVGTNNDVNVTPSRATDATCQIRDFDRPELTAVPGGNIPDVADELYQVVAELRRSGPADIPIYHRGSQPMLEVGVRFDDRTGRSVDRESDERSSLGSIVGQYDDESIQNGVLIFREPAPEKVVRLDVPERWLYPGDVEEIVRQRLSRKSAQDAIHIALKPDKRKNAYVYQASFEIR
jgi:HKD family nuclease